MSDNVTLSEGARLIYLELMAPPATPMSAAELSDSLCAFSAHQIGQWLRELRIARRAVALDARTGAGVDRVQSGQRVVWKGV